MKKSQVQSELIMEYFQQHPNKDIHHPEVVDWADEEYTKRTGLKFRDPDRAIRQLAQSGTLIKIGKGIYRYDPNSIENRELEDFTLEQKEEIFKRDGYKCVYCGKGRADGVEICADHIKPKDLGGKAEIINGQTLCAQHNLLKKNFRQTETGQKMFIRLYELAKKEDNKQLVDFCSAILNTYERYDINGHIHWEK